VVGKGEDGKCNFIKCCGVTATGRRQGRERAKRQSLAEKSRAGFSTEHLSNLQLGMDRAVNQWQEHKPTFAIQGGPTVPFDQVPALSRIRKGACLKPQVARSGRFRGAPTNCFAACLLLPLNQIIKSICIRQLRSAAKVFKLIIGLIQTDKFDQKGFHFYVQSCTRISCLTIFDMRLPP